METILCAAIHYDDGLKHPHQKIPYGVNTGYVLCGYRHHNINAAYPENPEFNRSIITPTKCIQGFMTSKGRFVDREEALKLAIEAGQVNKDKVGGILYSEDLY